MAMEQQIEQIGIENAVNSIFASSHTLYKNASEFEENFHTYNTLPIHTINKIQQDCENIMKMLNVVRRRGRIK